MPALCPLCALDENTSDGVAVDGRRFVICVTSEHGPDGYVWEPTPTRRQRTRSDGLGNELDIWDKLLECVPADGSVHSYGVVEDRLFELYPREAAILQERSGIAGGKARSR